MELMHLQLRFDIALKTLRHQQRVSRRRRLLLTSPPARLHWKLVVQAPGAVYQRAQRQASALASALLYRWQPESHSSSSYVVESAVKCHRWRKTRRRFSHHHINQRSYIHGGCQNWEAITITIKDISNLYHHTVDVILWAKVFQDGDMEDIMRCACMMR